MPLRVALTTLWPPVGLSAERPYTVVGTGQTKCFDNGGEIAPPKPGQPFYGQDVQHPGPPPSFTLSADGLTVQANLTALSGAEAVVEYVQTSYPVDGRDLAVDPVACRYTMSATTRQ